MKALADENFPYAAVNELRRRGWDVVVVQDWLLSASDEGVAAKSRAEGRVLLTFDKDFGEIWRKDVSGPGGAIFLFRLPRLSAAETVHRVVSVLISRTDWSGFWVVEAERVRTRKTSS